MNLVISQALASGLPVVSTKHSGIPDQVIDNVNGFLVAEGDYKALADVLLKLINEPELINELSKNCRSRVFENFDKNKNLKKQLIYYTKLLDNTKDW